jgi:hypothetical protein
MLYWKIYTTNGKNIFTYKYLQTVYCRQEHVLSESPIFFDPIANVIGTTLIKYVNMYANSLNTFPIYDQSMQVRAHSPFDVLVRVQ